MKSFKEFLNEITTLNEQNEFKYKPKTLPELKVLVNDLSINLGDIDTSSITSFRNLFEKCKRTDFSGIGKWNTSKVKSLENTFCFCDNFNEDISNWDVSRVSTMEGTFTECKKFNQPLDKWNVSNVERMINTFKGCDNFNQPLNNWDVSKVVYMIGMFESCRNFNQPLNKWNVSKVESIYCMFNNAKSFKQDISKWNPKLEDISIETMDERVFVNCPIPNKFKPFSDKIIKTITPKSYGKGFVEVFKKIKPEVDKLAKEEGYEYIPTINDIRDGYNSFIQNMFRYPDYYMEHSRRDGDQGDANHLLSEEFFKEIKYAIGRNKPTSEHYGDYEKILFSVSSKYFKNKYGRFQCTGNEAAAEILGDEYAKKFFEISEKIFGGNQLSELGLS